VHTFRFVQMRFPPKLRKRPRLLKGMEIFRLRVSWTRFRWTRFRCCSWENVHVREACPLLSRIYIQFIFNFLSCNLCLSRNITMCLEIKSCPFEIYLFIYRILPTKTNKLTLVPKRHKRLTTEIYACILKAHSHSKSGGSIWASLEC
jgi:hypothetical protein